MGTAFAERATERPTGSMWEKPLAAAAWTATTPPTAKRSKMFTFIRWCATRGSSYAAISRGKQIRNQKIPPARNRSCCFASPDIDVGPASYRAVVADGDGFPRRRGGYA